VRIVLLGPPGSGKGTQGRLLGSRLGIPVFGMGDLLRGEIRKGTDIGLSIEPVLASGNFPPNDLVMDVLFNHLEGCDSFILDGFPRDDAQAEALDSFLCARQRPLMGAFFFHLSENLLLSRLLNRYVCSSCDAPYVKNVREPEIVDVCDFCGGTGFTSRQDDREDVARARIERARLRDKMVLEYYAKKGILQEVDGSLSVEEVTEQVFSCLGSLCPV